jgi:DNA-binding NtrC family response regulator
MKKVIQQIQQVANSDFSVIIQGETGTGKTYIANIIHNLSGRAKGPFVTVDLGAIPEPLVESELFGYEKGAFTGALTRHIGLFEQANGSTLFLDEIGDLTLGTQAKILRSLQEKEIRRIAGRENVKLDVRIVAATNKRLEEEISKGNFREDLYYRLNVIAFTVPPLRERKTDIPILVEHFLKKLNESNGKKRTLSNEALQAVLNYSWPGNVRQLESVLERAYIMCDEDVIDLEHMPEETKHEGASNSSERLKLVADHLIDAKLTAAEYRLYLYLSKLDAHGKEDADLPEPRVIMERLGINRDTFFVGIARLRELGLYDFKARRGKGRRPAAPTGH